jgi:SAM-dependent methyltransferase
MTGESRSSGRRLRRLLGQSVGTSNRPSGVAAAQGDQEASDSTEVVSTTPTAEGPEIISIAEFRRRFENGALSMQVQATFCVENQALTAGIQDPCSPEYSAAVMETWHALTGRSDYRALDDETFALDDQDYLARPWPFCSSDPVVVGNYLGAVAAIIGRIGAKPPARIVEFGAGWGHLSLDLAATGFRVSAVDLNPPSVALLRRRAELLGVDVDVVEASFLEFEPDGEVDVFIFFESFHHCEEPFELLDRCTRQLRAGGRILFAADAIYDDFHSPWGVRLDGSATFMAAQHGWLELGFSRPFFEDQLRRRGFDVVWEVRPELGAYGTFLTATRGDRQKNSS